MVVLAGCGDGLPRPAATPSQRGTTSPQPSPRGEGVASRTLVGIDSLMWQQPDSALTVMMEFAGSEEADSMDVFEGHYCQMLIAELLYKNRYAQSNRTEVLKAVGYFDSIVNVADGRNAGARGKADARGASVRERDVFLDSRAHYIKGVGYYERDSLIEACGEYLCALRIMEGHFGKNELVGKKARFMALTYNRLLELFNAQYMQEPAIYCSRQSLSYDKIAQTSPDKIAITYFFIGKQYGKLKEEDSAAYYYKMALEILPDRKTSLYRDVVSYLALSEYSAGHDALASLDSLKSMAEQAQDEKERLGRFLFIGSIYQDIGQNDSAKVYLEPVLEKRAKGMKVAALYLREAAITEGDTLKANQYSQFLGEVAASNPESQVRASTLNDLFQSYLQEKQEAASLRERRKAVRLTLMVLVPLLLAIGLAVAIVMRRRHRKRLAAQEAEAQQRLEEERQSHRMEQAALSGRLKRSNETLRELQDQVRQQGDMVPKPETLAESFAEEPICRLIMERVNEGHFKSQMDCTAYKEYALGKEQVTALREAADRHFGQFTSRLAKAYPDLTRGDLDYCCLYLLGLSDADVAALMQKAYPTVSHRARKMKAVFKSEAPLPTTLLDFAKESNG